MTFENDHDACGCEPQHHLTADERILAAISATLHRLADEARQCGHMDLARNLEETAKTVISELCESHHHRILTSRQGDSGSLH